MTRRCWLSFLEMRGFTVRMDARALFCAFACLVGLTSIGFAEEKTESTVSAVSPDKKFAMRIVHDAGFGANEEIDSSAIHAIELIALPSKKVVTQLLPEEDVGLNFTGVKLLWSPDSKWCAFSHHEPRIGYTQVLRRVGDDFQRAHNATDLLVDVKTVVKGAGSVRNEYVVPKRWTKPGVLLLQQQSILRDEGGEIILQLVARWDAKKAEFRVSSKKLVSSQ
jgi:hypothetical protein